MRSSFVSVAALVANLFMTGPVDAKTPGKEYCYRKVCHRVKTLDETRLLIGVTDLLKASYYDSTERDALNPRNETSSGEILRADRPDNAASPVYPDGTKLLIWDPGSHKALVVRINNAGPYWKDRNLDLSRAAAEILGFASSGLASVWVRVLEAPTEDLATYCRARAYDPVRRYIGSFASLDAAADENARTVQAEPMVVAAAHVGGGHGEDSRGDGRQVSRGHSSGVRAFARSSGRSKTATRSHATAHASGHPQARAAGRGHGLHFSHNRHYRQEVGRRRAPVRRVGDVLQAQISL